MLTGTHIRTVDGKGRLVLPPAFHSLGPTVTLTRALQGEVLALSAPAWRRLLRRYARDPDIRAYFLSGAARVPVSGSENRITIPADLRTWAGLLKRKDAVLAGIGHAVVISTPGRWSERLQATEGLLVALLGSGR